MTHRRYDRHRLARDDHRSASRVRSAHNSLTRATAARRPYHHASRYKPELGQQCRREVTSSLPIFRLNAYCLYEPASGAGASSATAFLSAKRLLAKIFAAGARRAPASLSSPSSDWRRLCQLNAQVRTAEQYRRAHLRRRNNFTVTLASAAARPRLDVCPYNHVASIDYNGIFVGRAICRSLVNTEDALTAEIVTAVASMRVATR